MIRSCRNLLVLIILACACSEPAADSDSITPSQTEETDAAQRWIGEIESEAHENNLGVWGVEARLTSGPRDAPKVYQIGFRPEEVTCLSGTETRLAVLGPGTAISFATKGDINDSDPPGVFATSVELDC